MRLRYLSGALLAVVALAAAPAVAGTCRTEKMSCATNMPVDGYCECSARGTTEGGTVISRPISRRPLNSTSGGCGDHPKDAGCR